MIDTSVTIEGLPHMKAQFRELSDKMQRAVMRKALTQTGAIVGRRLGRRCR